jgi:hypothetical protein
VTSKSAAASANADAAGQARGEDLVQVTLEGGPADMAATVLVWRAAITDGCLKLEHLGGYEHFEQVASDDEPAGARPAMFRWRARTRIAE